MRLIDADALIECLQTWKTVAASEGLPINERFAAAMIAQVNLMPTIEPERTEYIADTKALPSNRDCVDLSERVTATFYDDEHEEWSKKTVTIRDILDSVCDDYTVIEPERKKGEWIHGKELSREMIGDCVTAIFYDGWKCSECDCLVEEEREPLYNYCPHCGADMRGEQE